MSVARLDGGVNIAGMGFPIHISVSDEGGIGQEVTVPKAYAGNLSTRTSATAGVFTTTSTHNLDVGDFFDFYFADGVAYNCEVTVETDTTITFTGGTGTDGDGGEALPLATTTGQVGERKVITTAFLGTAVSAVAAYCSVGRGHIAFIDTAVAELTVDIADGEGWFWIEGLGYANPITGDDIDEIWVSTADTIADRTFYVGVQYDSV